MKDKKELNNVIIFAAILLLFTIGYIVIDKIINKEKDENVEFLKDYKVNEYIPVYISEEDMAKILEVSEATYRNKETGKTQFKLDEMFVIADYFDKTMDDVFIGGKKE